MSQTMDIYDNGWSDNKQYGYLCTRKYYKDFDLTIFINGSYGNKVFNYLRMKLGIDNYEQEELFQLTNRVLELKDEDFIGIFDWLSDSMSCISQTNIGEKIEFDRLPDNARKAEKDRTIDQGWQ